MNTKTGILGGKLCEACYQATKQQMYQTTLPLDDIIIIEIVDFDHIIRSH